MEFENNIEKKEIIAGYLISQNYILKITKNYLTFNELLPNEYYYYDLDLKNPHFFKEFIDFENSNFHNHKHFNCDKGKNIINRYINSKILIKK